MSDTNGHDVDISEGKSPSPQNDRDALSAQSRRKLKQREIVNKLIAEAKALGSLTLDLTNKKLRKVPDEVLELTQLEYLYLEGNELSCLPDDFFHKLPNLRWLDVRRNYLAALPSTYIGSHKCLRTLLLEGNELRTLPLELGLVESMNGLNISNNPLEFPPQAVVDRGTLTVLAFFRELLRAKSEGHIPTMPRLEDLRIPGYSDDSSDEEWGLGSSYHRKDFNRHSSSNKHSLKSSHSELHESSLSLNGPGHGSESGAALQDLVGPVPSTVSLHQPPNYMHMKQIQAEKLRKSGAGVLLENSRRASGKRAAASQQAAPYEQPVSQDRVTQKYIEEKRVARLRELKEKQELVLQRRRDAEAIREWRDDGKRLQMEKTREKYVNGGKLDFAEPATQAPFGYEDQHLKMASNKDRIATEVRAKHEKIRRAMSPASVQRMEDARAQRDQELELKIKSHMADMAERRKQPKGTPHEEMAVAQKELQMAERLQEELQHRRRDMEYRFTAFTADVNYKTPVKQKVLK